jgi:hypothetical protein
MSSQFWQDEEIETQDGSDIRWDHSASKSQARLWYQICLIVKLMWFIPSLYTITHKVNEQLRNLEDILHEW